MRLMAALAVLFVLSPVVSAEMAGGVDAGGRSSSSSGIGGWGGAGVHEGSSSSSNIAIQAHLIREDDGPDGTCAGGLAKQAGKKCEGAAASGPAISKQASHYFLSRWYDLCDVVDFSFGGGPGFLINAHATKLAQIGGGYSDAYHVGFRGRSAGFWREKRKEIGVSLLYYQKVKRERITGWVESFRSEKMDLDTSQVYANNNDRSFLGVGATIHVGVLVDVNVRPMQALDFALGWLTIDVLEDDTGKPRRNKDL